MLKDSATLKKRFIFFEFINLVYSFLINHFAAEAESLLFLYWAAIQYICWILEWAPTTSWNHFQLPLLSMAAHAHGFCNDPRTDHAAA